MRKHELAYRSRKEERVRIQRRHLLLIIPLLTLVIWLSSCYVSWEVGYISVKGKSIVLICSSHWLGLDCVGEWQNANLSGVADGMAISTYEAKDSPIRSRLHSGLLKVIGIYPQTARQEFFDRATAKAFLERVKDGTRWSVLMKPILATRVSLHISFPTLLLFEVAGLVEYLRRK